MVDIAVLLMAYGTPHSDDEIEAYLTDIRGGRKPSPEAVEDLKERYRKIGGRSPLLEITNAQASALEEKLNSHDVKARVYVGMKHWHPYIDEVVPKILNEGPRKLIALVLAPHYSHMSIGGYKKAIDKALESSQNVHVDFVESWYDHPLFHQAVAERITAALKQFPNPTKIQVIFTAHSLPERILQQNDPYPEQLRLTCDAVAKLSNIDDWTLAYQSASITGEKWLGPDVLETLHELSRHGDHEVLIVPIGFVADHLEILYDIDIEAQIFALAHRLALKRTESLNTSSTFITALADIVRKRI